jgi:hypothetical protein
MAKRNMEVRDTYNSDILYIFFDIDDGFRLWISRLRKPNKDGGEIILKEIEQSYDRLVKVEAAYDERITKVKQEIATLEKKLKRAVFNRENMNRELELSKEALERLLNEANRYDDKDKEKRIYKMILSMDESEKEDFCKGIDELIETIPERIELLGIFRQAGSVERGNYDYNLEEVLPVVMERLAQKGEISDLLLQKVFLLLDKIEIRKRRGEYPARYIFDRQPDELVEQIIKWFVDNVYEADEDFVKRNYNLKDEKEEKKEEADNGEEPKHK